MHNIGGKVLFLYTQRQRAAKAIIEHRNHKQSLEHTKEHQCDEKHRGSFIIADGVVSYLRACCSFSIVARFGVEVGLREVRVSLSRMWCVLCTLCLCVWSAHVQRVVGPVSCHVEATFSRRAARVGADVKDGERCVCSCRM